MWQREQLNKLTKNGQVGAIKIDKLHKKSKDQKAAVEEAEDRGQFMAMAEEGEDSVSDTNISEALL